MSADARGLKWIGSLGSIPLRFPLPLFFSIAFTAYLLLQHPTSFNQFVELGLASVLPAGFLWTLAAALLAEAQGRSRVWGYMVAAAGVAIIVLLKVFSKALYLHLPLLFGALALLVALVAFIGSGRSENQFWLFCYRLALGLVVAALAAIVFIVGVNLTIDAFGYLFRVNVEHEVSLWIWTIGYGFLIPVVWLGFLPDRFDEALEDGGPTDLLGRALIAVGTFILMPLALIYAVILHSYAAMILINFELPRGHLGWLVIFLGVLLAATIFAVFPARHSGGMLVRFFWRIWPWLLPIPVGLLFLALGARLQQYGWTEYRYLLGLAGLWLLALFVTQILPKKWRDLRVSVALLVGLLLFAAVGPWSMIGFPTHMLLAELDTRLVTTGIVKDGRLVDAHDDSEKLSEEDYYRIIEIINYLDSRHRLNLLRPIFEGAKKDPFIPGEFVYVPKKSLLDRLWDDEQETVPGKTDRSLRVDILVGLGIAGPRAPPVYFVVRFIAESPTLLASEQHRTFIGPFYSPRINHSKEKKADYRGYEISFLDNVAQVLETKTGRFSRFEVEKSRELMTRLRQATKEGRTRLAGEGHSVSHKPVVMKQDTGELGAVLHVIDATGQQMANDQIRVDKISFWIAVAP